jgi:hypothetical protein
MFTMETWKERFPMESMLPDDLIFQYNKGATAAFRVADPHRITRSELGWVRSIDHEICSYPQRPDTTPVPIPSRTGGAYSEWSKLRLIRAAMKKSATGLSMRAAQRKSRKAMPPRMALT